MANATKETRTLLSGMGGADLLGVVGFSSDEELAAGLEDDARQMRAAHGRFLLRLGEAARREMFRGDGATSTEAWAVERFGVSVGTARSYAHVAEKAQDLPHLVGAMCAGEVSFDKARAVVDVATPETERQLLEAARQCTVRELAEVARVAAERSGSRRAGHAGRPDSRSEHEGRYVRCNDKFRTISAQLPRESYAEAKACLDARAAQVPAEPETPLDQRRCDGFMEMVRSSMPGGSSSSGGSDGSGQDTSKSPFIVVVHAPLEALVDDAGETSELAGELEREGLIDCATVQRIACDATVVVAVDDALGHTMYEGRARRFPNPAQRREVMRRDRHCRFPGCEHADFTNVHHIVPWKPGGPTDLDNLALLCRHHHGVVHRNGWSMTGDANAELHFVGPTGRAMTSRPSPLWARISGRRRPGPPSG